MCNKLIENRCKVNSIWMRGTKNRSMFYVQRSRFRQIQKSGKILFLARFARARRERRER